MRSTSARGRASGFEYCGGDLFSPVAVGPSTPVVAYYDLGLAECDDDIDALHYDNDSGYYYSLAPGSPSLASCSPILGWPVGGCGAAEVFIQADFQSPASVYRASATLGLGRMTISTNSTCCPNPASWRSSSPDRG